MRTSICGFMALLASTGLVTAPLPAMAQDDVVAAAQPAMQTIRVPVDTRIFISTLEGLVGKKGLISDDQRVRAEIWKDVVVDGKEM